MVTRIARIGAVVVLVGMLIAPGAQAHHAPPYPSGPLHEWGEMLAYPMVFPVDGTNTFGNSFYSPRCCDPGEIHHATDIMSPKMTPVLAIAPGVVRSVNWSHDPNNIDLTRCCTLAIEHDDGMETWYIHLNNDTPGTDDGQGWGVADGILPGVRVAAGQLIGWVGDSGNAESTSPHLHFELMDDYGVRVNAYQALVDAKAAGGIPRCAGLAATIFGDSDGDGTITGTAGADVIVGTLGDDEIDGLGGDDVICGGDGHDVIDAGPGADRVFGDAGDDTLRGGDDADILRGGSGGDTLEGGDGDDDLFGEGGNDLLRGDDGDDELTAGTGNDRMFGGRGRDVLVSDAGFNRLFGGGGRDRVVYEHRTVPVTVVLGDVGTDRVKSVERVFGSPQSDTITGDNRRNDLFGLGGHDLIVGTAGEDKLIGGTGDDWLDGGADADRLVGGPGNDTGDGGDGDDTCDVETASTCEF